MAKAGEPTGLVSVMRGLVAESGWWGMYAGVGAYVISCMQPAMQFGLFEKVKEAMLVGRGATSTLTLKESLLLGAATKAVAATVVQPITRARIIAQSRGGNEGLFATLSYMVREEGGVRALFRGLTPELTQGALSAAIMMMAKEKVRGGRAKRVAGSWPPLYH